MHIVSWRKNIMGDPPKPSTNVRANWKHIAGIAAIGLVIYIIVPQVGALKSSLPLLRGIRVWWLGAGIAALLASYIPATLNYLLLAQKPLKFGRTLVVELAATCINRLLPSGIGSLGVNYLYLRRSKHSAGAAGTIIFLNNILGTIGLAIILVILFCVQPQILTRIHISHPSYLTKWLIVGCVIVVCIALLWIKSLWNKIRHTVADIIRSLHWYIKHPAHVGLALISSMLITVCYTACLYASAHALGVTLSATDALVAMTVSVLGSTVVPTPGGLGGAEAGLFVGLVAYGIASPTALAVTLLYRLLTYWLPLVIGAVVALPLRGKGYF